MQWNLHNIRQSRNEDSLSGRPDLLYFLLDMTGSRDLMTPISVEDIEIAEQVWCTRSPEHGCSEEFLELVSLVTDEKRLIVPRTPTDALSLFHTLIDDIIKI